MLFEVLVLLCYGVVAWRWATAPHESYYTDPRAGWCPSSKGTAFIEQCCTAAFVGQNTTVPAFGREQGSISVQHNFGMPAALMLAAAALESVAVVLRVLETVAILRGKRGGYSISRSKPLLEVF